MSLLTLFAGLNNRRIPGAAPPSVVLIGESIVPISTPPRIHDYWRRDRDRRTLDSVLALVDAGDLDPAEATALLHAWRVRL